MTMKHRLEQVQARNVPPHARKVFLKEVHPIYHDCALDPSLPYATLISVDSSL